MFDSTYLNQDKMKKLTLKSCTFINGILLFGLSSFNLPINILSSSKPIEKTIGVQFTENSLTEILKKAKKEKKNIFLDAMQAGVDHVKC